MDSSDLLQHTQERGMVMGTKLKIIARDPFDGPITLQMEDDSELIIGHAIAVTVLVELV
jgi:Fe2+ transport system protein FeoA